MALITGAVLSAKVKVRYGGSTSQRLIQLTNQDNTSATTIDDDVIDACSEDAIGKFLTTTGINPDIDNVTHVSTLVTGCIYFLEFYKGRDAGLLKLHEKSFFAGLMNLNKRKMALPVSNSPLEQTLERQNSRPDMDRGRNVWKAGRHVGQSFEQIEISQ